MVDRRKLALKAMEEALRQRRSLGMALQDAVCVYDIAESLGIEVRFVGDISSFEGMYRRTNPPHILISSLRPPGRQVYTCAHEIGLNFPEIGRRGDKTLHYQAGGKER